MLLLYTLKCNPGWCVFFRCSKKSSFHHHSKWGIYSRLNNLGSAVNRVRHLDYNIVAKNPYVFDNVHAVLHVVHDPHQCHSTYMVIHTYIQTYIHLHSTMLRREKAPNALLELSFTEACRTCSFQLNSQLVGCTFWTVFEVLQPTYFTSCKKA